MVSGSGSVYGAPGRAVYRLGLKFQIQDRAKRPDSTSIDSTDSNAIVL